MYIPAAEVEIEIKIKNSRFIGTVGHTPTTEAAREFIAGIRTRYGSALVYVIVPS